MISRSATLFMCILCILGCGRSVDSAHTTESCISENAARVHAGKVAVLIGSSSASGSGATTSALGYAGQLSAWLASRGQGESLANLALGGSTTCALRPAGFSFGTCTAIDTARNVDAALEKSPSLLLIHLPSNDAGKGIPLSTSIANLDTIIRKAQGQGVDVLLIGAQPRPMSGPNLNTQKGWARALDSWKGVDKVTIWDSLALDSAHMRAELTADGTHPNDLGHAIIYRMILRSNAWQDHFPTSVSVWSRKAEESCGEE